MSENCDLDAVSHNAVSYNDSLVQFLLSCQSNSFWLENESAYLLFPALQGVCSNVLKGCGNVLKVGMFKGWGNVLMVGMFKGCGILNGIQGVAHSILDYSMPVL